jgi:hypothetical protein
MKHSALTRPVRSCWLLLLLVATNCMPAAPAAAPPPAPPFQPNFTYKVPSSGTKTDVTLGILEPQFGEDANLYQKQGDPTVKKMISALRDSLGELLIAKGLKTTGPFTSLNDMTFPDKKAADLVLYPEVNFSAEVVFSNPHAAPAVEKKNGGTLFELPSIGKKTEEATPAATPGAPAAQICDAKLTVTGKMKLVVVEPTTGAKMMNKPVEVGTADQSFASQPCPIVGAKPAFSRELQEAWDKAHEVLFQSSMKSFDAYVNVEELQKYKADAQELRDKKVYN